MLVRIQKSPDLELHVGLIIQCRENEKFGVVLGCVNSEIRWHNSTYSYPVLYYFSKDLKQEIPALTPVSFFIQKFHGFEAFDVKSLYSYKVCDRDGDTKLRSDGYYYTDAVWKAMNSKDCYIAHSYHGNNTLYVPILKLVGKLRYYRGERMCTIFPSDKNASIVCFDVVMNAEENSLINCFLQLLEIGNVAYPSVEEIGQQLKEISNRVESCDVTSVLDTYEVGTCGYYQCRPGRDDHFHIVKYWRLGKDDAYIKSLLPIKEESTYYSCCGRGTDEQDYQVVDIDATNNYKNKALSMYSKENHIAYLLKDFFMGKIESVNKYNAIIQKMKDLMHYSEAMTDVDCFYSFNYEGEILAINKTICKLRDNYMNRTKGAKI